MRQCQTHTTQSAGQQFRSKDMLKHHIQIQGARHVAQLNTVASKDKGGKMFAPQTFLDWLWGLFWGYTTKALHEKTL